MSVYNNSDNWGSSWTQASLENHESDRLSQKIDDLSKILSLTDAVKEVKEGKKPFSFAKVLHEEEKHFFDSLSNEQLKCAFKEIDLVNCFFSSDNSINISSSEVKKASAILRRILQELGDHKIDSFKTALMSNSPTWHVDGSLQLNSKKTLRLRMTLAFKGDTTQFFVPTKAEYDKFVEMNDEKSILQEVERITAANPSKAIVGDPYDVCIFHTRTIHRGYPNKNDSIRILLTINSSTEETSPIALQFEDQPN